MTSARIRSCFAVFALAVAGLLAGPAPAAADLEPGQLRWAKRAGGTALDQGLAVATFADGSLVATGAFGEGYTDGRATFGAGEPGETVLQAEGPTVGGNFNPDLFLARYRPDGSLLWAKRYGGRFGEAGRGVAALPDGSCVVAGWQNGSDVLLSRYAAGGSLTWSRGAGGPGADAALAVAAFADGSCVITGYFTSSATFGAGEPGTTTLTDASGERTFFLARYAADGSLVWAKQGKGFVEANGVVSFADGTCAVTGHFDRRATFGLGEAGQTELVSDLADRAHSVLNPFIARFRADGTLLWARSPGGDLSSRTYSIAGFADGSSVISGLFLRTAVFGREEGAPITVTAVSSDPDIFVVRYEADGSVRWARRDGGVGGEEPRGVASTPDGASIVTGSFGGQTRLGSGDPVGVTFTAPNTATFVVQYDANGVMEWARQDGGPTGRPYGVSAFADGSAVVTGEFSGSAPSVWGAGEPNETTLASAGGWDVFVLRLAGDETVEIVAPSAIVQPCDEGEHGATVNFLIEVRGTPPGTSVLTVRDVTQDRTLLDVQATTGTVGVGPHVFPLGASTVEVRITDGDRELATASWVVQIEDPEPPLLLGCTAKTIECSGPVTPIHPTLLGVSAADHCDPAPTVTLAPNSLPLGATVVTATARDASGNARACEFLVTVQDTVPPRFEVCPEDRVVPCTEPAGATVAFDVLAVDLCGEVSVTCRDETGRTVHGTGTVFALGPHTVTCTASDEAGNVAECVFLVTVTDVVNPVILCPADLVVPTEPGRCGAHVAFEAFATDDCDPNVEITCEALWGPVASGDEFPLGSTEVTCRARDVAGNDATCSFSILVLDEEPPVLTVPSTVTLVTDCAGGDLTVTPASLGATATDACDPAPSLLVSPSVLAPGTSGVLVTATDASGNRTERTVQVTVLLGPLTCRFLRPLDENVDNWFRLGRTVPLKVLITCDNEFRSQPTVLLDEVVATDDAGTPLVNPVIDDAGLANDEGRLFRLADGFFVYNLSTQGWPSVPGARYRVRVRVQEPGRLDTLCVVVLVTQ